MFGIMLKKKGYSLKPFFFCFVKLVGQCMQVDVILFLYNS